MLVGVLCFLFLKSDSMSRGKKPKGGKTLAIVLETHYQAFALFLKITISDKL